MTTKVQGTAGIEFPDSTVQGSAAFTKAQATAQTWQNVTASRLSNNTAYVNNTALPITVQARVVSSGEEQMYAIVTVNGQEVATFEMYAPTATYKMNVNFVVPVGASYGFTSPQTLQRWMELR